MTDWIVSLSVSCRMWLIMPGSGSFLNIAGRLSMIEVATDGSVFGVNSQGNLFQR